MHAPTGNLQYEPAGGACTMHCVAVRGYAHQCHGLVSAKEAADHLSLLGSFLPSLPPAG